MAKSRAFLHLVTATCFAAALPAYGWGHQGHQLVNKVAVEMMTTPLKDLFASNLQSFCDMAVVPDTQWKRQGRQGDLEKGTHFFEWDIYAETGLGSSMPIILQEASDVIEPRQIIENGSAVWRVNQIYELLVAAIRNKRWTEVIQMGGVLGHYVGDLAQPMHVTSDYDGQSIGRRGIHKYFEIDLLEKKNEGEVYRQVLEAASRSHNVFDGASGIEVVATMFEGAKESLGLLPALLEIFAAKGRYDDEKLSPHLITTLAFASSSFAALLDKAYVEANVSEVSQERHEVEDPEWVAFDPCASAVASASCDVLPSNFRIAY